MKKSEEYKPLRQKIVVLTGAGISAESGLATFRDSNGLWKQHDAKKLASTAGFEENPQAVLDFYNYRRKQLLEVEPNHAHKMLAELDLGRVGIVPNPKLMATELGAYYAANIHLINKLEI